MNAIMSLGMFAFSISTLSYDQLQRKTDYRHARTTRVGARDATQFVGEGDDKISLTGTAYAELSDGAASLDELRDMARQGDGLPLVCANGRMYGTYVITGIDERHAIFLPDGTPLAIDFAIDLLGVDDSAEQAEADA